VRRLVTYFKLLHLSFALGLHGRILRSAEVRINVKETHPLPITPTRLGSFQLFLDVGEIAFGSRTVSNGLYEAKVLVGVQKKEEIGDEIGGHLVDCLLAHFWEMTHRPSCRSRSMHRPLPWSL
jgi:hypothetical protein